MLWAHAETATLIDLGDVKWHHHIGEKVWQFSSKFDPLFKPEFLSWMFIQEKWKHMSSKNSY